MSATFLYSNYIEGARIQNTVFAGIRRRQDDRGGTGPGTRRRNPLESRRILDRIEGEDVGVRAAPCFLHDQSQRIRFDGRERHLAQAEGV